MTKRLATILSFAFAVFGASELVSRILIPVSQTKQVSRPHMHEDHPELGYRLKNNLRTRVQATNGTEKLFDVVYVTDQFGRRTVPLAETERRENHFIILGGSTVFGMGLADHQTLAYQLAGRASKIQPYNYASDGYGPQNAYTQARLGLLANEVSEPEGVTVFFFQMLNQSGGHVQTLLGTFELLLDGWGESLSFYDIDASGARAPSFLGRMRGFDPIKFYTFRFIQNFHLINTIYPKLWPLEEVQLKQTAYFLRDLKSEVLRSKPKTRFVIVFHPLSDRNSVGRLKALIESEAIESFDYSRIIEEKDLSSHIAFNRYFPHPNGKLNSLLAQKLAEDLQLNR